MAKIHQLPSHIIAKIAAGEVIERPAYAVKELIDNAIDARADEISIFIEQAGLKKIQVTDNGEGMSKEDLEESTKPHTTSKITPNDELLGIKTLGFRGEALASLTAVSHVTIKSRTADSPSGNELKITNGKVIKVSPVGTPFGTTVIAENFFSAIPARKKFLKTPQTEFRHIAEVVANFALSYPHVHFLLKHNNKIIFDFSKNQLVEERIKKILGEETFFHFLKVNKEDSYTSLSGFIAKPQINTSSQNKQYVFVNNRRISDKLISLAVKESFGTMLEPTVYPIFILYITTPHEMVDINVHPRKEHVAFINQKSIFQTIKDAVTETLQENNITFQNLSWHRSGVGKTNSFAANLLRETVLDSNSLAVKKEAPVTQMHNLYIVTETKHGLLIFDQHGAHERVLFEKLLSEFKRQRKKQELFKLKTPVTIKFSSSEQELLLEHKKVFETVGFKISANCKSITHVPFLLQDRNPQELIKEILEKLEDDLPANSIDRVSEEMIAFLACRAAVKAEDSLTQEQMRKIISELEKTPNNATCPHGRPTRIYFDKREIDTMFKR